MIEGRRLANAARADLRRMRTATFGFGYDGPDGEAAYLVLFEDSDRQPSASQLDDMIAKTTGIPVKVVSDDDDVYGDGYVFEFVATATR